MSHFDHVANEWDSAQKISLMAALSKKTIQKLNLNKKMDILDFGCGTGLFGLEFEPFAKTLTGIDTSNGMLEVMQEKSKGLKHVSVLNLDLQTDSMPSDLSFDLIISSMVFHHLDNPLSVLEKLSKSLLSGGTIAVVDLREEDGSFHPDPSNMGVKHFGFSDEVIKAWAKELDFTVEISTINSLEKNEKIYEQFLAIFKKA